MTDDLTFYANTLGFLYSASAGAWQQMATPLPVPGNAAHCSTATTADGTTYIVMAGGFNYTETFVGYRETFLLDVADLSGQWAEGPLLPRPLRRGKVVKTPGSFLILGGEYTTGDWWYSDDAILEFDVEGMAWVEREERLSQTLHSAFAVPVDRAKYCV